MRSYLFIWSVALLFSACSDQGRVLYRDEEYIKKAQSRPTKFKDFKCQKENVVGRWYEIPKEATATTKVSSCIWKFNEDGSIDSKGEHCSKDMPERFEISRVYSEITNAFLDIQLFYRNGKMKIVADCVTDGKVMKFDEGGWTFYKVY